LLANLGTPDEPTPAALRRYLAEFLWDARVIEEPRWKWWLILNLIILRIRPRKSAALYKSIWGEDGSPLLTTSIEQKKKLGSLLSRKAQVPHAVELGMRYGNPSIALALTKLRDAGTERLVVLPLYPQYSSSTTGSTFDAISQELQRWRWVPEFRFITSYHEHPGYIGALVASIEEAWREQGKPEKLVMSFHGIPERYLLNGDPYHCQCQKTARLVAERLGLNEDQYLVTFQSLFGKEEWLRPYTDETMERLAKEGVRKLHVMCPGFSADCLETLEEIEGENKDIFLQHGGDEFRYIPALNARDDIVSAFLDVILTKTSDWWQDKEFFSEQRAELSRQEYEKGKQTSPICPHQNATTPSQPAPRREQAGTGS